MQAELLHVLQKFGWKEHKKECRSSCVARLDSNLHKDFVSPQAEAVDRWITLSLSKSFTGCESTFFLRLFWNNHGSIDVNLFQTLAVDEADALIQVDSKMWESCKQALDQVIVQASSRAQNLQLMKGAETALKMWWKRERRGGANFTSQEICNVGLDTLCLLHTNDPRVTLLDALPPPEEIRKSYCGVVRCMGPG